MSKLQSIRSFFFRGGDGFSVILLLLCAYKFVFKISRGKDLILADEGNYLSWGMRLNFLDLPPDGWVYLLWYKILSWVQSDPVALYYLNLKLLLCIPPILFYILLRSLNMRPFSAMAASLLVMVSALSVDSWPHITKLALGLILLTCILVVRARSLRGRLLIMTVGSLALAYTRSEFFISFAVIWVLTAVWFVREIIREKENSGIKAALRIMWPNPAIHGFVLIVVLLIGSPLNQGRSVHAFGQHFAINYTAHHKLDLNPAADYVIILNKVFGSADSVMGFLLSNPGEFLNHVYLNVLQFVIHSATLVMPLTAKPYRGGEIFAFASVLLLVATIFVLITRRHRIIDVAREKQAFPPLFYLALVLPPSLASTLIIFPRPHYLLMLLVPLFAVCLLVIAYSGLLRMRVSRAWGLILAPVILFAVPHAAAGAWGFGRIQNIHEKNACTVLNRIRTLRSLNIKERVNILDTLGTIHVYAGSNYHNVSDHDKKENFGAYAKRHRINMVLTNPRLRTALRFGDDPDFQKLMDKPEVFGFRRFPMGTCKGEFILFRSGPG